MYVTTRDTWRYNELIIDCNSKFREGKSKSTEI